MTTTANNNYDEDTFENSSRTENSSQKEKFHSTNNDKLRNINTKQNLIFKENSFININASEDKSQYFNEVYQKWLKTRMETLEKLKVLLYDLHKNQLCFNKVQVVCRKTGCFSRQVKSNVQSGSLDFVASLAAFFSDTSSGIVSAAQAVNIENCQGKFQEIIDQDAKMTKHMYEVRSQCIAEYDGIEEVFRNFKSVTFDSTLAEVSNALEVNKFLTAIENAYRNDNKNRVLRLMEDFVEKGCQSEVLQNVNHSLQMYANSNPAALDVCKSAGRAVYGVLDTVGFNKNDGNLDHQESNISTKWLIEQDKNVIAQLQNTVEENLSQSKLEEKIQDAIDSLTSEMDEVNNSYMQQLGDQISDDYKFDN